MVNIGSLLPGTAASYTVNGTMHYVRQPSAASKSKHRSASKQPNLPVNLLLQLMALDNPSVDLKYIDVEDNLKDMGLTGILKVNEMPKELLVNIGCLGPNGADKLHKYIRERRILPFIQGDSEGVERGKMTAWRMTKKRVEVAKKLA